MSRPAHVITDFNKLQKPTPIQKVAPVPRAAPPTKPVCNNNILISIQKGKENRKTDEKVRLRKVNIIFKRQNKSFQPVMYFFFPK